MHELDIDHRWCVFAMHIKANTLLRQNAHLFPIQLFCLRNIYIYIYKKVIRKEADKIYPLSLYKNKGINK